MFRHFYEPDVPISGIRLSDWFHHRCAPWVMGRREPLAVYGPKGIVAMTKHVLAAWQVDIDAARCFSHTCIRTTPQAIPTSSSRR